MANDVTVNINADTNMPEAVDKSKKALSQMENAVQGMNKKVENFGKELLLSYVAPMVLLNRAIDYVANKIEENRQKIKEALEFAAKGESKQLEPATVSLARKQVERAQELEDKAKAVKAKEVVTEDFLRTASDADMERFYKRMGPGSRLMLASTTFEGAAKDVNIQNAVRDIENANLMREEEARRKSPPGIDTLGVQNAVFGMGTSPIIASMEQQLTVQREQADTLRRIEERLPAKEEDYTKGEATVYKPTISFR